MTFLPKTKKCRKCGKIKSQDEFALNGTTSPDGLSAQCTKCYRPTKRQYKWEAHLQNKFCMDAFAYNLILKAQNGVCAICKQPEVIKQNNNIIRLAVDHNHKTGKIRGLLCSTCNLLLAHVENRPEILEAIPKYLQKENE